MGRIGEGWLQALRAPRSVADIETQIATTTSPPPSSTEYLLNGGKLEVTQLMVDHESSRTTGIYDHRSDRVSLDEVERICI